MTLSRRFILQKFLQRYFLIVVTCGLFFVYKDEETWVVDSLLEITECLLHHMKESQHQPQNLANRKCSINVE